jgi:hypothetical protein
MIALWAVARETDVAAYATTLLLPGYLAHLELAPVEICQQIPVRDGREPLVLTYRGEGRLEQFPLDPRAHALGLIRFLCPGVDTSRIQLPQDDAAWLWPAPDDPHALRVYFSATAQVLNRSLDAPVGQQAFVSVSRLTTFVGRSIVERYLHAWLEHLNLAADGLVMALGMPSGEVEFRAGAVAGQMLVDDPVSAGDLLHFAGLDRRLEELADLVRLDFSQPPVGPYGVREDGVYLRLVPKVEE